jgi:hypothetical protein
MQPRKMELVPEPAARILCRVRQWPVLASSLQYRQAESFQWTARVYLGGTGPSFSDLLFTITWNPNSNEVDCAHENLDCPLTRVGARQDAAY